MRVNEIFDSLSGEVDGFGGQGKPTTFIRLQGCNFPHGGCSYCDSLIAHNPADKSEFITTDKVLRRINMPKVIITGGEPMIQYDAVEMLVRRLFAVDIPTTIETNGSIVIPRDFTDSNYCIARKRLLRIVMDYKLPSSGMEKFMDMEAFKLLRSWDVIKFVIADETDYEQMKELLGSHLWEAQIAISPVLDDSALDTAQKYELARKLALIMLQDPDLRNAQFSLQLHKLLGVK